MSQRPHVYISHRQKAPSGESPNIYVGQMNVEIRIYWTPTSDYEEVYEMLEEAAIEASDELHKKMRGTK